jgi:endonuclease/exonuclease/phosphatase family metal-dependent hydrolase
MATDNNSIVRVMTWNIHGGVGPDGHRDLGRVVELVRRHSPDVVALQEVDSRRARQGEKPHSSSGRLAWRARGRCESDHRA